MALEIEEYSLIESDDSDKFIDLLNSSIDGGWVPQGGLAIISGELGNYYRFNQLIVKYKQPKTNKISKTKIKD